MSLHVGTSGWAYPEWKPAFYPAAPAAEGLPRVLRGPADRVRDQRHLLPGAVGVDRHPLGRRDAARLPLRGQGASAADPLAGASAGRGGRRVPRALPGVPHRARRPPRGGAAAVPGHAGPRRRRAGRSAWVPAARAAGGARVPQRLVGRPRRGRPHRGRGRHGVPLRDRGRGARAAAARAGGLRAPAGESCTRTRPARAGATCSSASRTTGRCSPSPSTRASRPATPTPASGWRSGWSAPGLSRVDQSAVPGIRVKIIFPEGL